MAMDAKLPEIELKNSNFNSEVQEQVAEELLEMWEEEGPTSYTDMERIYGTASDSVYQSVMDRHMGPPDHGLTVEEIRARHGSVKEYLERRKHGDIETDTRELADGEVKMLKEWYSEGYSDGWMACYREFVENNESSTNGA